MRTALICGAGGFIGSHLVRRLKAEGIWVRGAHLKLPQFGETAADDFVLGDLRKLEFCQSALDRRIDEVCQLAANMGGAGYIFIGSNDADIMHNSATINLKVLETAQCRGVGPIFYSSSACIYPAYNQEDAENPNCVEAVPIRRRRTVSTGGRNCSASAYTSRISLTAHTGSRGLLS